MNAGGRVQHGLDLTLLREILRQLALMDEVLDHAVAVVAHARAARRAESLPAAETRATSGERLARGLYLLHRNDQLAEAVRQAIQQGTSDSPDPPPHVPRL
jgi:hypothetical protein